MLIGHLKGLAPGCRQSLRYVYYSLADHRRNLYRDEFRDERLAAEGQLMAYRHESFWQCMDTLRDKRLLETLWELGEAPWKTWS